jgi:hypothetical protein
MSYFSFLYFLELKPIEALCFYSNLHLDTVMQKTKSVGTEIWNLRLVSVVGWLYLTLIYVMFAFSLSLAHYGSSSRLQLLVHNHISISRTSLLFSSQHHHFRLNHFRI